MSQLLQQVHINQRLLKESDNSNPASPMLSNGSVLSPMALNPTSPQGMPIPKRNNTMQDGGTWMVNQNLLTGGGANQATWNGLNGFNQDLSYDLAMDALEVPEISGDLDSFAMEGELSKLSMAVDEDDIFKSENADLLGPTLAELNAPDADTLLDGLSFDDLYWPPESAPPMDTASALSPQTPVAGNTMDSTDAVEIMLQAQQQQQQQQSQASSLPNSGMIKIVPTLGQSVPIVNTILEQTLNQPALTLTTTADFSFLNQNIITTTPQTQPQSGGLRELLLRRDLQNSLESPDPSALGQTIPRSTLSPSPGPPGSPRLSSSAPSQGNTAWEQWQQRREQVWQRREPRPHLISTGSLAEGSTSSISENVLSPGRDFSLSMDEGFDSDDNSDNDSSDGESDVSDTESNNGKRERFFWQYNVQAKGPKGQRLVLAPTQEDPHVLQRPTDPVFSPLCHIQGIKHSGKARKGDGNDLTPNPRKLWSIGKELDRLNKVIAEMTPVADVPNAVKSRSRKEKNKLASRACRLKKKAQHEANKLKLFGLEQEHKRLLNAIDQSRQMIFAELDGTGELTTETLSARVETIAKTGILTHRIGGHTTEFVNKVLEKVDSGVQDGGIGEL